MSVRWSCRSKVPCAPRRRFIAWGHKNNVAIFLRCFWSALVGCAHLEGKNEGKNQLDCRLTRFAGSYSHYLLHGGNKDFSIPDLACASDIYNCIENAVDQFFVNHDLDLYFRQKVNHILGAAIKFCVAFLPPEPLHLANRKPAHTDFVKSFAYFIEFEGLDDGLYFFHGSCPAVDRMSSSIESSNSCFGSF